MNKRKRTPYLQASLLVLAVLIILGSLLIMRWYTKKGFRTRRLLAWLRHPERHPTWQQSAGERCQDAPFLFPTDGYIGFVWRDSFRPGHTHQGIDIFSPADPGVTPVLAAYPGYVTRLEDWKSSLIIRVPQDPLHPERQIWTYYTHLADAQGRSFISAQFPAGTKEVYVSEGTLLGYQGNYSGNPDSPVGTHLHFSIVKDDGHGHFRNELRITNTLDPSPYFGMTLTANSLGKKIPRCREHKGSVDDSLSR